MKKLITVCTMAVMLILPMVANAATIDIGAAKGTYNPDPSKGFGQIFTKSSGSGYVTCANSWTNNCTTGYVTLTYTSSTTKYNTGGVGTLLVLSGCSVSACTCSPAQIPLKSGSTVISCLECPSNGTCSNGVLTCNKGTYRNGNNICTACESGATTDAAGATKHTECCYPANYTGSDTSGSWKYTAKCCYTS